MGKFLDGLMSGRYSKKKEIPGKPVDEKAADGNLKEEEEEEQRGIAPRMLKRVLCKGHIDFEGMQQQDAYEFFQHVIKTIQKNERLFSRRLRIYSSFLLLERTGKKRIPLKRFWQSSSKRISVKNVNIFDTQLSIKRKSNFPFLWNALSLPCTQWKVYLIHARHVMKFIGFKTRGN
jgi:hypothetical protein